MSQVEIIDPTRLRDALQCPRLFYWRHERGVVPVAPRLPLSYGGGVHATLAEHYKGKTSGQALLAFEAVWDVEVRPFSHYLVEEDPKRNPRRWAEVFIVYKKHYAKEPFEVLYIETPFFLPLTDDLALAGIIDLLVKYLNQLMVIDHKTSYSLGPQFFATFNPNHQFSAYLLGATEILGEPVTTLLVNCLLSHKNEMRPEKLFQRVPTTRSLYQHEFLKEEIVSFWTHSIRAYREHNSWPRNDDRCQRYPGGCEYHPLCTDVNVDYRKIIPSPSQYRESVWDPIRELRQHGFKEEVS